MPFTILQAGTSLQLMDTDGSLTTLTLPATVTLRDDTPPRFMVFRNTVYLVNTPSAPLQIDGHGTVRPMTPKPPQTAPLVSVGGSGTLSGNYSGLRYTFYIKDADGTLLAESDYSPPSGSVTLTSDMLRVSGLETSDEPISGRRIYRPTTDGAVLFPWIDVDGNTVTTVEDDLADVALSIIAAPILGTPPKLVLLAEWRNRLWGVGDTDLDELRFAEAELRWSWPASNGITIAGSGTDHFGIKALMPRRDALGVGRRNIIYQITGSTPDDFNSVKLSQEVGVESNETVVTYRDTVWWLWKDGVYQWDSDGIRNIADGKVKSWFSSDDYFNRDEFINAFAVFDPLKLKYKLFLASAGSSVIDRWVEYDIQTKTWWGPHLTSTFDPTCAFQLVDINDKVEYVIGADDAFVWQESPGATDNLSDGIAISLITKWFDGGLPYYEKYWGELAVIGKAQSAGTITITPTVGYLNASASTPLFYDMTQGRQSLDRIGIGQFMKLTLTHDTYDEPIELYGFELSYHPVGRR